MLCGRRRIRGREGCYGAANEIRGSFPIALLRVRMTGCGWRRGRTGDSRFLAALGMTTRKARTKAKSKSKSRSRSKSKSKSRSKSKSNDKSKCGGPSPYRVRMTAKNKQQQRKRRSLWLRLLRVRGVSFTASSCCGGTPGCCGSCLACRREAPWLRPARGG